MSTNQALEGKWRSAVYDRQQEKNDVDPGMARNWFDVAYGFALAHGLEPGQAYDFSLGLAERGLL